MSLREYVVGLAGGLLIFLVVYAFITVTLLTLGGSW